MSYATRRWALVLAALACVSWGGSARSGGGLFRRRAVTIIPTATVGNPANANAPSPMLGTFYSTPYVIIGGAGPTGGGYSPLGQYGPSNLTLYGPMSIYRSVTAPVTVYSRGYDGRVYESQGHSFSTPFLPRSSPVIYPTANSNYYRPRGTSAPPWWTTGNGWIDQN